MGQQRTTAPEGRVATQDAEHVVFFTTVAGEPAAERYPTLSGAVERVEGLRNGDGVADALVFQLVPVPLQVRQYFRVEIAAGSLPTAVGPAGTSARSPLPPPARPPVAPPALRPAAPPAPASPAYVESYEPGPEQAVTPDAAPGDAALDDARDVSGGGSGDGFGAGSGGSSPEIAEDVADDGAPVTADGAEVHPARPDEADAQAGAHDGTNADADVDVDVDAEAHADTAGGSEGAAPPPPEAPPHPDGTGSADSEQPVTGFFAP